VLHQSAGHEDIFPIEIDLDQVRRQRETGIMGLGQVLKSFRDRSAEFPVYDRASGADAYLHELGPLKMPEQGSRSGAAPEAGGHGLGSGQSDPGSFMEGGARIAPFIGRIASG
jgi:hypothetical protein